MCYSAMVIVYGWLGVGALYYREKVLVQFGCHLSCGVLCVHNWLARHLLCVVLSHCSSLNSLKQIKEFTYAFAPGFICQATKIRRLLPFEWAATTQLKCI